jgi:two-component system response regulator NreC
VDTANVAHTRPDHLGRQAGFGHRCTGVCRERSDNVRVLLCEKQALFRHGIRLLLAETSDLTVCCDVSSLSSLDGLAGSPDVVVHGLVFPEAEGPVVVRAVREAFPAAALVVLTQFANPLHVHLCLTAGANGYVSKSASPEEFLTAVRAVARGDDFVQPALGAALARWRDFPRRQTTDSPVGLTDRESEVLALLAAGHTNAETAEALGIALRTVESHRAHISQKLGLRRRADLVRYVSEHRLV